MLPFTVGQALKQGDVPAGSALVSAIPDFQSIVKNRWPDGSAKFAILSGRIDLVANTWKSIGLGVASAPPAPSPVISTTDLMATGVTASVQFGAFGTAAWNAGDWGTPVQTWVSGPQMSAFTYRKTIGGDDHLVAWLEVRAYKGGKVEVLPWVENGYLRTASPTSKTGTATFTLDGNVRFSQSLALLNHQRAVLASGTTLTHWHGGDPQITPRQSAGYLMATKLVPNYRGITTSSSAVFSRLPAGYTPLAQASYRTDMSDAGYSPTIGLLPEWDVAYLTADSDPRAYRAVLINAYAAGRYGVHYRDETTNKPFKFSSYPNLVMSNGSGVVSIGSSSTGSYTPAPSGSSPPIYDSPHHPSMGYMAYLLTGWNYYLEETQLLATANYLKQNDSTRLYSKGVFESSAGANTTRGAAWAIRTLSQAAAITPDDDNLRSELVNSVTENISYYHSKYVAMPNNPLGLVATYDHYTSTDPWQSSVWMDDFFTASFGYLKELQVNSAAVQTKLDQFLAWKYRSIVGRLGGSGSSEFSYRYGAQYIVPYAPTNTANWNTGTGPWYANWGEVARVMGLATSGNLGESLVSGYPEEATGYWGNLMPAIAYAVDHNAAGAIAAWDRIMSASNFPAQAAQYNDNPVWGVKPRTH
jgi:hypothetical protein